MENASYTTLTRQAGLLREMQVVAHNIANTNTPGFKAERLIFQEFLSNPQSRDSLSFVTDIGTARDMDTGPLSSTGNTFDIALSGDGFFTIETPLGERYTRHGRFQLDGERQLVTSEGYPVLGQNGPLTIPTDEGEISIASDGTITTEDTQVGQIQVVTFEDPQQLRKAASGLFIAPDGVDAQEPDTVQMVQGMVEESNVQPILEITRMMGIHRTHDSVARMLRQENDRVKDMIDTLGKPAQA